MLNLGVVGWSVGQGQPKMLSTLDLLKINMPLSPILSMILRASLTFVLGLGASMIAVQEHTICFGTASLPCNLAHPVFAATEAGDKELMRDGL